LCFRSNWVTASEKSILVIQNDPALAESITRTLTTEGFEVLACAHSDRAQLMAPQAQAILCDFRLDAGDGAEIITTLRQGGFRRPVIMMSEDRTRAVVNKCIKAGITDFLPKPFTAEALLEKIGKHLASGFA
jgi:DNA-binding response OmpR family regulator